MEANNSRRLKKKQALRSKSILILKRIVGVVVSLCTFNVVRVRLVELLKTDSMRHELADFQWTKTEIKSYSSKHWTTGIIVQLVVHREKKKIYAMI